MTSSIIADILNIRTNQGGYMKGLLILILMISIAHNFEMVTKYKNEKYRAPIERIDDETTELLQQARLRRLKSMRLE